MRTQTTGLALLLLLMLLCSSCSKPQRSIGEAQLSAGKVSLQVDTDDAASLPLYDRVDLVLLPKQPDTLLAEFAGSTEYFDAIRGAGGFYVGGDYLEDAERGSSSVTYELDAPVGALPDGQQGWLLLLVLDGTAVKVDGFHPVSELK